MSDTPAVELRGISISFPGVKALDDVDLTLRPGEIHALMGENGAGKSTLIKALTGVYRIDAGRIVVAGVERVFGSAADAQASGISTVYQEVNLCTNLSVGENVMLGYERRRAFGIDWSATHREATRQLERLGLDLDPRSPLGSHSIAVQQLIAITRAMVLGSDVLILDEPTSSLDRGEVAQLFEVMRELRRRGAAILFVSHFLDQIYEISDRMTVLRNGALVGDYLVADLPRQRLIALMLGRELAELDGIAEARPSDVVREGEPALQVLALGKRGSIEPVDLALFDGEVVGVAGLLGSGRTELARLLAGADRPDSGEVRRSGRRSRLGTPRAALRQRIAFSSENRRAEGIVGDLTVRENIALGVQAARGWARPLSRTAQTELARKYIETMGITPADPEALIRNLSGGNQQKALLARWLATAPEILILDEPTRGIDVGAKAEIQKLVGDLAAEGLAVLFISSELDEVVRVAQRICVLRDRQKIAEIDTREDVTVDDIIRLIAGGEAA